MRKYYAWTYFEGQAYVPATMHLPLRDRKRDFFNHRFGWEWSSRLPVEKSFLLFFAYEKELGHVSKIVKLFSNSLSILASPQAKNDFWLDHLSDRKCKFQRFCPARGDCNNIAHGVTWCSQLVHKLNMETLPEIFSIPTWSEETLLLDLNLHIKNLLICTKEFSKCRR